MAKSIYKRLRSYDEDGDEVFVMKKFTPDLDPAGEYVIQMSSSGQLICDCPARQKECRHIRMMELFDNAEAGQDDIYNLIAEENPDHEVWLQTDSKTSEWVSGFLKEVVNG